MGGAQPGSGAGTQRAGRLPDPRATPDGELGAAGLAPEGLLQGPPERWPLRPAGRVPAARLTGQEGSVPGFHADDSSAAELRCPAGQRPSAPPAPASFTRGRKRAESQVRSVTGTEARVKADGAGPPSTPQSLGCPVPPQPPGPGPDRRARVVLSVEKAERPARRRLSPRAAGVPPSPQPIPLRPQSLATGRLGGRQAVGWPPGLYLSEPPCRESKSLHLPGSCLLHRRTAFRHTDVIPLRSTHASI